MRRRGVVTIAIVAALVVSACGGDDKAAPTASSKDPNLVTVAAAPGLEPVLARVVDSFRRDQPFVQIQIGTQDHKALVATVTDKAADVAVLPDSWLEEVPSGLNLGSFGNNRAVIAVPSGNPANVSDVTVFAAGSGRRTAVCGDASSKLNLNLYVLAKAGIKPDPTTVGLGCQVDALQQLVA